MYILQPEWRKLPQNKHTRVSTGIWNIPQYFIAQKQKTVKKENQRSCFGERQ
jgi:hypothetical protein